MNAGGVKSILLVVAGEGQPVVLAVPAGISSAAAGILTQAAVVTYLVLILYPAQFSAVGGVFAPHVTPSSKLYSILKPATVGGGVTTIGPQPVLTVGAETAGNTTNIAVSAQMVGCAAVKMARQQPGVVGVNTPVDASMLPPPFIVQVPPGGTTFSVNVTGPPPTQEFTVVATALGYIISGY